MSGTLALLSRYFQSVKSTLQQGNSTHQFQKYTHTQYQTVNFNLKPSTSKVVVTFSFFVENGPHSPPCSI